jgi:hypothetical protein
MTRITFLLIFTLLISFSSSALALSITGKNKLDQIIITLLKENILDDRYNDSPKIGEIICKAYGGDYCSGDSIGEAICKAGGGDYCSGDSIGEGICKAGGGDYCSGDSIGEGICKAGGGDYCSGDSIGEGICKAVGGDYCSGDSIEEALNKIPKHDTDWAWDQFHHSTGSLVWSCRGIQTGQFAELERCAGKSKNDDRWPNK